VTQTVKLSLAIGLIAFASLLSRPTQAADCASICLKHCQSAGGASHTMCLTNCQNNCQARSAAAKKKRKK
jgi:hypothetical protein